MHDLTAILLCGGKGERLKPFTETLPKPLVPLNGRPLLELLMRYLAAGGVSRFVVCTGYKAEAIEEFIAKEADPRWEVVCVNSGDVSMTDRIADASTHVPGRAIICYGDTLANVDLEALQSFHESREVDATLSVYPLHSPFGIVSIDASDRVTEFAEKPQLPYWINIGFLVCERRALDKVRRGSDMVTFLSQLAAAGALAAYRHSGRHLTVNTEKERADAETQIEFFTLLEGKGP